jgi:CheY-like chemotaxis protein
VHAHHFVNISERKHAEADAQLLTGLQVRIRRLPAIALSAFTRTEGRLNALAAGFQMHVAKPVEMEELMTVIASLTGRLA